MSAIGSVASSLDQLRQSLDQATKWNESVPPYAARTITAGNKPSFVGAQYARMHHYVGSPDLADRKLAETIATSGIDLAATRNNPELAPLVNGAEQAVQRYRDSVFAAHAALDAAAKAFRK